jgi:hypothetical protein
MTVDDVVVIVAGTEQEEDMSCTGPIPEDPVAINQEEKKDPDDHAPGQASATDARCMAPKEESPPSNVPHDETRYNEALFGAESQETNILTDVNPKKKEEWNEVDPKSAVLVDQ